MRRSLRLALLLQVALAGTVVSQSTTVSGKIVDAEEGNGLNAVEVSLLKSGLRTTTLKNGAWSLSLPVGVSRREAGERPVRSGLRLQDGRLALRLDDRDILGRGFGGSSSSGISTTAARAMAEVLDTLLISRTGFVPRRVPVLSTGLVDRIDSLRRVRGPEWVDSSHSNGFSPDTVDAFPDTLRTITLRIAKAQWNRMVQAMADSCGPFGRPTDCALTQLDHIDNAALIWQTGDLEADGQVWKNVGIRLKGNNSLSTTWARKAHTFPFRVTMDKYEDSLPTTKNQRFHGFKKFSLYNAIQDASGIREAVAGEIFRDAKVPSSMSVPVRMVLVHGDTTKDLGAYAMVEVPDNPLLNRAFGNDSGNLYKPMSGLASFVESEFADDDLVTDYADVKALIAAVNDPRRTTAPAAWRADLEKTLDMKGWLRWLAVSNAIGNWDMYGVYPHNYYLYNDAGRLRWITYDLGWSLVPVSEGFVWFEDPPEEPFTFPLIRNALADPVYCREYVARLTEAISDTGVFAAARFRAKVDRYGKLVSRFSSTVAPVKELRTYPDSRHPQIRAALARQGCP